MQRKIARAVLAAAIVLMSSIALAVAAQTSGATSDTQVSIVNYAFKAPTVTIAAGTAVVWTNKDDDPHTVTADDGSFDSKGLGQGDTYKHVFTKAGTYPYHCSAHPYMKGTVIVQGGN